MAEAGSRSSSSTIPEAGGAGVPMQWPAGEEVGGQRSPQREMRWNALRSWAGGGAATLWITL